MDQSLKTFAQIVTYSALSLCLLSFLGFLLPFFDSLNVIRPLTWFTAGLGSFALPKIPQTLVRFIIVITAFPFLIFIDQSQDLKRHSLRILQHNLLYTNTAPDLQMLVENLEPDVLNLQEIRKARPTIDALQDYKYRQICNFESVGDVGVISKRPFLQAGCAQGKKRGFAWAQIENQQGAPVTIVSIHLHWPFPFQQTAQLDELVPELEALPRPIVMTGDLNQVAWSHSADRLARAVDAPLLEGLRFTLVLPPLFLPIDHAFGAGAHEVRRLDRHGSDHNALLIDFQDWPKFTQGPENGL